MSALNPSTNPVGVTASPTVLTTAKQSAKLPKLYRVVREHVSRVGGNAAAVLRHLAYLVEHTNIPPIMGKRWWWCTLARGPVKRYTHQPLSDSFPWLTPKALHNIVRKLKNARLIEIGPRGMNRLNLDKTSWYHVSDDVIQTFKVDKIAGRRSSGVHDRNPRYFNPDEASKLGINCALVLNVLYRSFAVQLRKTSAKHLELNASAIGQELGLPPQTVRDSIRKLVSQRYLSTYSGGKVHALLVEIPANIEKLPSRGRKHVARLGLPVEYISSEQLAMITSALQAGNSRRPNKDAAPGTGLAELTKGVNEQMAELMKAKKLKKQQKLEHKGKKRRKGRKPPDQSMRLVGRGKP